MLDRSAVRQTQRGGKKTKLATLHVKQSHGDQILTVRSSPTCIRYRSTRILYTVNTFHLSPLHYCDIYADIHPIDSMRMQAHHPLSSPKCGDHYPMMWMWTAINKTGSDLEMFMRWATKKQARAGLFPTSLFQKRPNYNTKTISQNQTMEGGYPCARTRAHACTHLNTCSGLHSCVPLEIKRLNSVKYTWKCLYQLSSSFLWSLRRCSK